MEENQAQHTDVRWQGARTIKPISPETGAASTNAGYEIIDCSEHALVEIMSRGQQHFCEIKLLLTIPLMLWFKCLVHGHEIWAPQMNVSTKCVLLSRNPSSVDIAPHLVILSAARLFCPSDLHYFLQSLGMQARPLVEFLAFQIPSLRHKVSLAVFLTSLPCFAPAPSNPGNVISCSHAVFQVT